MYVDPRGGHNRGKYNQNIFETWTNPMAYVLGFLFADGALINAEQSSRTCYLSITSVDKQIIYQIRDVFTSNHNIYYRKPGIMIIRGKKYMRQGNYVLRIGSKHLFMSLLRLGLQPRKSKIMLFPPVPDDYLPCFIRGYFDGDGCLYVGRSQNRLRVSVIFTSGSERFQNSIQARLSKLIGLNTTIPFNQGYAFRLVYRNQKAVNLLHYLYRDLSAAPYLERKYRKYQSFLNREME